MKRETKRRLIKSIAIIAILGTIVTYGKFSFDEFVQEKIKSETLKKDQEIQGLKQAVQEQETSVKKLKQVLQLQKTKSKSMDKLLNDLDKCKYPKTTLGIGFSESRLKYAVTHPTSDLTGIGGIKPGYWSKLLAKRHIKVNSLQAIDTVYVALLNETKCTKEALKIYKGTGKNTKSFYITQAYIKAIDKSPNFEELIHANKLQTKLLKELETRES